MIFDLGGPLPAGANLVVTLDGVLNTRFPGVNYCKLDMVEYGGGSIVSSIVYYEINDIPEFLSFFVYPSNN